MRRGRDVGAPNNSKTYPGSRWARDLLEQLVAALLEGGDAVKETRGGGSEKVRRGC